MLDKIITEIFCEIKKFADSIRTEILNGVGDLILELTTNFEGFLTTATLTDASSVKDEIRNILKDLQNHNDGKAKELMENPIINDAVLAIVKPAMTKSATRANNHTLAVPDISSLAVSTANHPTNTILTAGDSVGNKRARPTGDDVGERSAKNPKVK